MYKFTFTILLALLLIGCASQPQPDKNEAYLIAAKNYQGLTEHYKSQLKETPEDKALMAKLTSAYFKANDLESARFYTQHLIKAGYDSADFLFLAGNVYMASEQYQDAISVLEQAQNKGYEGADLNVSLGISYSNLNELDKAQTQFNQARLKGHNDIAIKNNLAVIYIAKQQPEQAVRILTPVLQANPDNEKIRTNLAVALIKSEDYASAHQMLSKYYSDDEVMQLMRSIKAL